MVIPRWARKQTSPSEPDNQLGQLLNSLSDVVLHLDDEQHILYINQCWQTITQIPLEQTIGRPFTDFLHPEDLPKWQNLLQNQPQPHNNTNWFRLISSNGELRWCDLRIQADKTQPDYYVATLCDITPQVRKEQIKHAGFRSLQSLVDRLPAMLYRARNNASWTMEYLSEGCELITGYSAEDMLNQSQISLGDMIHPDDVDTVWEQVQLALQTQDYFDLCYRLTRADGQTISVQDKGRGLYSDSGMVLGVEGIIFKK